MLYDFPEYPRPVITRALYENRIDFRSDLVDQFTAAIPGKAVGGRTTRAFEAYNRGDYEIALAGFARIVALTRPAWNVLWPYVRICTRVVDKAFHGDDAASAKALARSNGLQDRMRAGARKFLHRQNLASVRCKYCAQYTNYIDPDEGLASLATNNCRWCQRGYPMPSWYWDSINGQAYIFYRRSVAAADFYKEFLEQFDVREDNDDNFGNAAARIKPSIPALGYPSPTASSESPSARQS